MDKDCKIRSGYRVIGNNTSDKRLSSWYFPNLEHANGFAKALCEDTGQEVEVCKYVGSWKKALPPVEFIASED